MKNFTFLFLGFAFFAAALIRFLYFPDNIYFGYDQARDAYISQDVLAGDLKIKGPPASYDSHIFHGALSYYIFAPFYLISSGDPTLVSIFLRIYNAAGVFLVFLISSKLFNRQSGLITSVLFALSYEQTQYALFLSHPSLGVLTVLLFYYGLVRMFYQKDSKGLLFAAVGLGLSVQAHFSLLFLTPALVGSFIIFRKNLPRFSIKVVLLSLMLLVLSLLTFIVSEFKYHDILNLLFGQKESLLPQKFLLLKFDNFFSQTIFQTYRYVHDNLIILPENSVLGVTIIVALFAIFYHSTRENKSKFFFFCLWFICGFIPYLVINSKIYYYGIGGSVSLLVLVGFLIHKLLCKSRILGFFLIFTVLVSNFYLITANNREKFNQYIVVQEGLVLPQEKKAIDYIYKNAAGQPFSVNAVMIPFNVRTTWDYLFNWYGRKNYGYVPTWGGDAAPGYEGRLTVNTNRASLPKKRFVIIEPEKNIPSYMISNFLKEEDYFSKVLETQNFGNITVQTREAI